MEESSLATATAEPAVTDKSKQTDQHIQNVLK